MKLKVKIETISSKLCEKCKKLLNKESNEEKKTQFLLSNTPHMSLPSSAKLLTYFTSIVVIFCLLCNFSPQISFLLKTSLNSNKKLVDKILECNKTGYCDTYKLKKQLIDDDQYICKVIQQYVPKEFKHYELIIDDMCDFFQVLCLNKLVDEQTHFTCT